MISSRDHFKRHRTRPKQEFIARNLQEGNSLYRGKIQSNDSVVISRSLSKLLKIKKGRLLGCTLLEAMNLHLEDESSLLEASIETGLEEF
jgi:hypothetical protein